MADSPAADAARIARLEAEADELARRLDALEEAASRAASGPAVRSVSGGAGINVAGVDGVYTVSAVPSFRYIQLPWLEGCFEEGST